MPCIQIIDKYNTLNQGKNTTKFAHLYLILKFAKKSDS